ncbi:VOC family protein [Streptosporangium sp. V21-05]|uniref:VOC family protein n=1 Tax=Streptosporangium sp. V21-05 TaxID=3446115 RepID=UPI003F53C192
MTATTYVPVLSPLILLTTLVVRDYDEALDLYLGGLGFRLLEDTPLGDRPPTRGPGDGMLLARADGPEREARIGDRTGGGVGLFPHTDDFARDYGRLPAAGVVFEGPRAASPTARSSSSRTCTATAGTCSSPPASHRRTAEPEPPRFRDPSSR